MDIPLPPAFPIPQAFVVPEPVLAPPQIKPLEWEPVPMYIETTPQAIPTPQPKPNLGEDGQAAGTEESEESPGQESQQSQEKPASGKAKDIKPPAV